MQGRQNAKKDNSVKGSGTAEARDAHGGSSELLQMKQLGIIGPVSAR